MKSRLWSAAGAFIISLGAIASANAALIPRLGGLAYYDDQLDITWATDATMVERDLWANQMAWVENLTIGGISGWRLPSADVNGDNILVDCQYATFDDCKDNEMGFLYWKEGIKESTPGPFINLASSTSNYWSNSEVGPSRPLDRWGFEFVSGSNWQGVISYSEHAAWAVHSGDVGAVPIPATVYLFGSGIIGLISIARRKKT